MVVVSTSAQVPPKHAPQHPRAPAHTPVLPYTQEEAAVPLQAEEMPPKSAMYPQLDPATGDDAGEKK